MGYKVTDTGLHLDVNLLPQQAKAMSLFNDNKTLFILYGGGAAGGKSWTGCACLLASALAYPGTHYFMAREELKSVRTSTLRTFYDVSDDWGVSHLWEYKSNKDYYIEFTNGSVITLIEMKYYPSDPLFKRFGSHEYTKGFIDEADECTWEGIQVLKSRTLRKKNKQYGLLGQVFMSCNPSNNWAYNKFYKPWSEGKLEYGYEFIQSLVYDNEFVDIEYINNLKLTLTDMFRKRLLEGDWHFLEIPNQLINFEKAAEMLDNPRIEGKKHMGVDVAHMGGDKSAIVKMNGNVVYFIKSYKESTTAFGRRVYEEAIYDRIDADRVAVDLLGVGSGTFDTLSENKFNVHRIQSGAAPVAKKSDIHGFTKLRSQMWWQAKMDIENNVICIDRTLDTGIVDKLIEDITSVCYDIRGDKVIQVEEKKDIKQRIGRSTDLGDAFVYANWIRHLKETKMSLMTYSDDEIWCSPCVTTKDLYFG
jgi:PBSX family phage terminase large subunit